MPINREFKTLDEYIEAADLIPHVHYGLGQALQDIALAHNIITGMKREFEDHPEQMRGAIVTVIHQTKFFDDAYADLLTDNNLPHRDLDEEVCKFEEHLLRIIGLWKLVIQSAQHDKAVHDAFRVTW